MKKKEAYNPLFCGSTTNDVRRGFRLEDRTRKKEEVWNTDLRYSTLIKDTVSENECSKFEDLSRLRLKGLRTPQCAL